MKITTGVWICGAVLLLSSCTGSKGSPGTDAGSGGRAPASDAGADRDAMTDVPSASGGQFGTGGTALGGAGGAAGAPAGSGGSMTGTGGATAAGGAGVAGQGGAGIGGGGATAGTGGAVAGTGGGASGAGGVTNGTGGSSAGTGGTLVGTGGTPAGTGGSVAGSGGSGTGGAGTGGASTGGSGTGGATPSPALLAGSTTAAYEGVEVGVASAGVVWTIRNDGGAATGALSLANGNPSELSITANTCTAGLDAGSSCTVTVAFSALAAGTRSGSLTVTASPGGSVTFAATAIGRYRLSVVVTGGGTVTSLPAGISCGVTCSLLVNPNTSLTLQARTTNGSDLVFSAWGGACSTADRDCTLTVANASVSVTAAFSTSTANLIFITSATVPVNLGSAVAYDAVCNGAATAAGINNTSGTAFIAYVSDANSLAKSRMPATARGWVRTDGKPFADTFASLVPGHRVFNSISLDEYGRPANRLVITGTQLDGSLATTTCQNWTSTAATDRGTLGSPGGGPGAWADSYLVTDCSYTATQLPMSLVCMGTTRSATVVPQVTVGKKVWVTGTAFMVGAGETPDEKCQSERPAGVSTAAALVAYTTRPASSVLDPAATYVRVDGTRVGTGAQMINSQVVSGIWQSADGTYQARQPGFFPNTDVWTGAWDLTTVSNAQSTCGDWTNSAQTGMPGNWAETRISWWRLGETAACTWGFRLYCVQTAP